MNTIPIAIYKKNNKEGFYAVIFKGGSGAWNNFYRIYKKASNAEEVVEWAKKVVLNSKWADKYKVSSKEWIAEMFGLSKEDVKCPAMAGYDYGCYDKDKKRFIIDGGYETYLFTDEPVGKSTFLYNSGSRNDPDMREVIIETPQWCYEISYGAGRSRKEKIYFSQIPKNLIYHHFLKYN